jgi:hypothetical protein
MRGALTKLGDRLLAKLVPSTRATACSYPTYCEFQFKACSGPYCYYYYQQWKTCKIFSGAVDGNCAGSKLVSQHSGCC